MKILCVGRNYAGHAREMGGSVPVSPLWFLKPDSAVIADGQAIAVPPGIGAVHHEVELAVRVGRLCRRVEAGEALRSLDGATVAIDVTARDLQAAAKAAGEPWTQSKGFDTFCPLGAWHAIDRDLQDIRLRLRIDGALRQDGHTGDMLWSVPELVAQASRWTTLRPGDVLLTGTPEGVGPLLPGQAVEAEAVGLAALRHPVAAGA